MHMTKFEEAVESYKATGIVVDNQLLEKVARSLGPSIFKADAEFIAASDKAELETVKKNFLIKKLGLADTPELDTAIQEAIDKMGRSNPRKHRAVFYTLLVERFGKQALFS